MADRVQSRSSSQALKGHAVPLGGARRVPRPVRGHLGGEPVKATDRPPHLEQREQPDFRDKPAVGAPAVAERKNLATGAVDARRPDAEFAARSRRRSCPGPMNCPPRSTARPARSVVSVRPPTRSRASRTTVAAPLSASRRAAARPESPAPTTTMSNRCIASFRLIFTSSTSTALSGDLVVERLRSAPSLFPRNSFGPAL